MPAGKEGIAEPDGDSGKGPVPGPGASAAPAGEPEGFEIVLPITVIVLSDEDFLQDDAEEQELSVPEVELEMSVPDVKQEMSVPEVVQEVTMLKVEQEVTVPEVVQEVSMPKVKQEVSMPKVEQEVSMPKVEQEVSMPKVEQEVSMPKVEQEVSMPEVMQKVSIPEVMQEVSMPKVEQEVSMPEVEQEVSMPEVEQEVSMPKVEQEVSMPEVMQKVSIPKVMQKVSIPKVMQEVSMPKVEQEVSMPEVMQKVSIPEVEQEVSMPEVEQEVSMPEVMQEVSMLEVKQEVSIPEVMQEVTVPEVMQKVSIPEVMQEVSVPEVMQKVSMPEVVQEVSIPEVVQEVSMPKVEQEVSMPEVMQEVSMLEVKQEVSMPKVEQEVSMPKVEQEVLVQEVTVPEVGQEVTLPEMVQEVTVPQVEQEYELNIICLKSDVAASNDSSSLSSWEENNTVSSTDDSVTYSEEKWLAEGVCHTSESSLSDGCDAGVDKCDQNCVLPTSSCKMQLAEINKTSGGNECDGGFQEIPPLLSSAGSEVRDDTRPVTLAAVPKNEELVSVTSVLCHGSPEEGPEIHEAVAEMEEPDSSTSGDTEADKRIPSKFEDDTLNSLSDHGFKEEQKSTSDCSEPFLNGCSPTFEGLLKDIGKPEVNVSTSVESDTIGEHIYKTLTPFPRKRYRQQKVVSSHANQKEFQSQQEGLVSLSNNVTLSPLSKTSYSTKKHERLNFKCRFCSSVYECSAHLKKHIYSAHKGKKIRKYCFCKRSFLYSFNLKNHLKFCKRINMLQKARKNRINARKRRQRDSEGRKSETKKRELKYEKFFIKIERDITPLGVPVSFSCRVCFFASSNPRSFIHHLKAHRERPPYQCPQCEYSCSTFSWLLTHMYWHAGYNLYQCRFCTFFSLYFAGMVRHSSIHTRAKPYSCEFCQLAFTSTSELKRHRRLHAGTGMCQGRQLNRVSRRKRTRRPLKNYACDECNLVFSTKGHLTFHKKFHEQLQAGGYIGQSNKYGKICKTEGDSQGRVSLFGRENGYLSGGMLPSEVDCEQTGDMQDNEKMLSVKKFPENSHGSNSLSVLGNRSEVPQTSYQMDTVMYQEELLFKSEPSNSQMQNDDAYHDIVENSKDPCPSNLDTFKTHRCKHCSYATDVDNNFRLHLKIHTAERPFVCKDCNETFKTSNRLQKHSILHVKNGQQELGSCLYIERCLENLELHHEMHGGRFPEWGFCSSEGSDSCLVGSEVFGIQSDVQRGRENDLSAQSQPPFYRCAECKYTTCMLSNLELHVRTHTGERPYTCTVCQMKFRTSSHLRRHRITHLNTQHFKCRSCDFSTDKWLSLKGHLALHSGEGSSSLSCLYEDKELPFKTYRCEECGYCTSRSGNLKLHLRIHTGERPFKCGQCALTFRTSSHLKRHLLTHLRLRCRRCKYSTMDKCAFQKHIKQHKKKYTCRKCNVVLPTKRLLEKHKQQHELGK